MSGASRTYALRPVAAALAAAPVPGLSKRHIRPQHTVICHTGSSLIQLQEQTDPSKTRERNIPPRGQITEFSSKSRQRLRMDLAKVDQHKAGKALFATLTYPNEFPWNYLIFKRHLHTFGKRFLRAFPNAGFHWKLEFQKRGAPHFHPIFWCISPTGKELSRFRAWVSENWYEVVGSGDVQHLHAGTSVELMRSQMAIMRYAAGYHSKSDQTLPGQTVGRYWGVVGRENIPRGIPVLRSIAPHEAAFVRRTMRRYMQSCNRVRRIKNAHNFAPDMTNDYLAGRYRQWRKRSPHMKAFKFRPRKVRHRNNQSVNLFCDANFWGRAIASLCELAARP